VSTETNKALVRRYWDEFWNAQQAAVADELFLPEQAARERRFAAALHPAFPDGRVTVETMVAEGDWVATRYTWRATHTGVWEWTAFGVFMGVHPTGAAVRESGMTFDRIAAGRIVEHRSSWDWAGLARQIGALTLPEAASPHRS
jgi:predicted ester cyclase